MSEGPFTDEAVRHMLTTVQTQHGIIKYAEAMAQVLAEAGRASKKATGDSASFAIDQWSEVIRKRAHEILNAERPKSKVQEAFEKEQARRKQLDAPT